jgi:hypothetical protein
MYLTDYLMTMIMFDVIILIVIKIQNMVFIVTSITLLYQFLIIVTNHYQYYYPFYP